jgi:hypothetical protein
MQTSPTITHPKLSFWGYVVESWDGTSCHTLPTVIECNKIPNDASEIPTPEVAKLHSHLNSIADKIPTDQIMLFYHPRASSFSVN